MHTKGWHGYALLAPVVTDCTNSKGVRIRARLFNKDTNKCKWESNVPGLESYANPKSPISSRIVFTPPVCAWQDPTSGEVKNVQHLGDKPLGGR